MHKWFFLSQSDIKNSILLIIYNNWFLVDKKILFRAWKCEGSERTIEEKVARLQAKIRECYSARNKDITGTIQQAGCQIIGCRI